jgi:tRNA-dihydrouridine synthase B
MKIGSVEIDRGAVLAPLAGITNLPHRLLSKSAGASLVCSEMVSANGLIRLNGKTLRIMDSHPDEKPVSVQIFGADPAIMAEAAGIVESAGADIVDINFGCSVRKVVKTGAGAALMNTPRLAESILNAVRNAIRVPLTIKIRSGWDSSGEQALEIARIAEGCGVDAIAAHPRTATQGFGGKADRSIIKKLKDTVSVPVIGNGDILTWRDAVEMIGETGCDAVMVGRAAIGNPFVFTQIAAALNGETPPEIDLDRRFDIIRKYLRDSVEYIGEKYGMRMMRSRLAWFIKGFPHSAQFRESIKLLSTEAEALERINAYETEVRAALNEKTAIAEP